LAAGQTITDGRAGRAGADRYAATDERTKSDQGLTLLDCHGLPPIS
jgi:hypothetical protein